MRSTQMNSMLSLFAIAFSLVSLITSIAAIVMILAQRWSTHKIEWKPLTIQDPSETSQNSKEIDDEDGKTLEEALNLQRKGKKQKDQDPLSEILETNNF